VPIAVTNNVPAKARYAWLNGDADAQRQVETGRHSRYEGIAVVSRTSPWTGEIYALLITSDGCQRRAVYDKFISTKLLAAPFTAVHLADYFTQVRGRIWQYGVTTFEYAVVVRRKRLDWLGHLSRMTSNGIHARQAMGVCRHGQEGALPPPLEML